MTTLSGNTLPTLSYAQNSLLLAASEMRAQLTRIGLSSGQVVDTIHKNEQPTVLPTAALTGNLITSYFQDFYNKLWAIPDIVQFGNIPTDGNGSNIKLVVWNTYATRAVTLDTLTLPADMGVSLSGIVSGQTIGPLQRVLVTVKASPTGPTRITGEINLGSSEVSASCIVPLIGVRLNAKLLPVLPNWADTVSLTLSYKTDIITSRDGSEQRRALRQTPRKSFSYTALVTNTNSYKVKALMRKCAASQFFIVDPIRHIILDDGLPIGSQTLSIADIPRWMTVGAFLIFTNNDIFEVREIQSIGETGIVFSSTTAYAWPERSMVSVALLGRLSDSPQIQHFTSTVSTIAISFICDPGSDPDYTVGSSGVITDGREVLPITPQWANAVADTFNWNREIIDNQYGLIDYYTPATFGMDVRQASFILDGNAQDFIDFFARMRGEAGEFFASSFVSDLDVRPETNLETLNFIINDYEISELYNDDNAIGLIELKMNNGALIYRKVTEITANNDGTVTLQLDTPVSDTTIYSVSQILRVSWLMLSRFMSDDVTISYLTDSLATVNINIASRPYQTEEVLTVTNGLS